MIYKGLSMGLKVLNCNLRDRNNQNASFWFFPSRYGFKKGDEITLDWLYDNLETINSDIKLQKDTKIIINW